MEMVHTGVVVVGAGAAGLLAAVVARRLENEVVLIEATDRVGGATATGDGTLWLPANQFMGQGSLPSDSFAEAMTYLGECLGTPRDRTERVRRETFARTAGPLGRWLTTSKIRVATVRGLPDEHEVSGAKAQGRCLVTNALPKRLLGDHASSVRGVVAEDDRPLPIVGGVQRLAQRVFGGGPEFAQGGPALVAELYRRALATGVELWLESPMTDLIVEDGSVTGVLVRRGEDLVELRAEHGVVLASGGFESHADLRDDHLPLPTHVDWTLSGRSNTGDALRVGRAAGAAVTSLGEAWWTPVMLAEGSAHAVDHARAVPHGLIVDQAGDRFFDESLSPVAAGTKLFERNRGMRAVPSFLIVDNRHRSTYDLGPWPAGNTPKAALDAGEIVRAATLDDLAVALGVDRAGLIGSVVAFNQSAGKGRDPDFGRGTTRAGKARGDASQRRSPNLAKVDRGPYWAVRIYPGDAGTRGGLAIDENGRVLTPSGGAIPGLYACGGAAATWITSGYPAPGAALAASLVEAYRAALSLSDQIDRLDSATL